MRFNHMRYILISVCWMIMAMAASAQTLFDFSLQGMDGKPMPLSQFKGKAVLLVNTASQCGFTPQYEGLEKLWETYKDKGLVIIGVPSNDFGGQEPGQAAEIASFCKLNYGVTFPLSDKTVVSGQGEAPVYTWAGAQAGLLGRPKWNFHKYLFAKSGAFVDWFATTTEPMSDKIKAAIERELAQ
ncbi:MAG: glutathione peroxidase [Alphaproteobacteria bacterium]|nr:glutathione peroxidase [Alphaproteobacteria bacterium]